MPRWLVGAEYQGPVQAPRSDAAFFAPVAHIVPELHLFGNITESIHHRRC